MGEEDIRQVIFEVKARNRNFQELITNNIRRLITQLDEASMLLNHPGVCGRTNMLEELDFLRKKSLAEIQRTFDSESRVWRKQIRTESLKITRVRGRPRDKK